MERQTEIYGIDLAILERIASFMLLAGIVCVFQWKYENWYEIGRILLQGGFVLYGAGMLINRTPILKFIERIIVVLMMIGMLGMFQPWNIKYYEDGFYLLAGATLAFIIISHIPAPANHSLEA